MSQLYLHHLVCCDMMYREFLHRSKAIGRNSPSAATVWHNQSRIGLWAQAAVRRRYAVSSKSNNWFLFHDLLHVPHPSWQLTERETLVTRCQLVTRCVQDVNHGPVHKEKLGRWLTSCHRTVTSNHFFLVVGLKSTTHFPFMSLSITCYVITNKTLACDCSPTTRSVVGMKEGRKKQVTDNCTFLLLVTCSLTDVCHVIPVQSMIDSKADVIWQTFTSLWSYKPSRFLQ